MRYCATKIHFSVFLPTLVSIALINKCNEDETVIVVPPIPPKVIVQKYQPPPPPPPTCESKIAARVPVDTRTLERYYHALPFVVIDTKTTSVHYLRKPKRTTAPKAREIANSLGNVARLAPAIRGLKKTYRKNRSMLRNIFLSEGYFFDERARVAHHLAKEITLTDLFSEPTIYRLRTNEVETLTLQENQYVDSDGERALLLINDRVASNPDDLLPPIHLDMDFVRAQTGAQRTVMTSLFTDGAALGLTFPGGEKRPALVLLKENRTHVDCIGGNVDTLADTLENAGLFWQHHEIVTNAAKRIVSERPRFDEPTDELEDVQEDGELRLAWKKAYRNRQKKFLFREVEYDVFDRKGNPIPPQVCVDFIVDTWERASGTWYTRRGEKPTRTDGKIDFYALEGVSRRYISSLLAHAREPNSPFSRYDLPRRDWGPLENRRRYVKKLAKHADHYQEGDLLVIHGLREEDMQEHYHTVLVLKTETVTGLPVLIADNQGRPRITNLVQAMRAAPKRSVKHRLRLDFNKMTYLTNQYREMKAQEAISNDTE